MPTCSADVDALAREVTYPVVIKPRRSRWRTASGFVAGGVAYAHSPETLRSMWEAMDARIPAPLVQERVTGFGMGLFILADRGIVLARFAHRRLREKPPSGGVSVLSESIQVPPELEAPADRLMAALDWRGVCMIEFKVDARDGRPVLMELNPRFWGSLELAIASGVDFPWLLYQLALGEAPEAQSSYRLGVRSRWELGDLDHLLIRLRNRGGRDLPSGAPSRLGALLAFLDPFAGRPEVFRLGDPGPGWHELRNYLRGWMGREKSPLRALYSGHRP
jgi:predicted ATP-grasp superfamily ATP-dependent carboligase